MAYTDDAVLAKLSALNETQESIVSIYWPSAWTSLIHFQVTVAQWVMFHRFARYLRSHASQCLHLIGDMPTGLDNFGYRDSKIREATRDWIWSILQMVCVVMIVAHVDLELKPCFRYTVLTRYAITEVAQQSKARRKDDFLIAFSPVIAEATATAYKGATNEVQQKLRRVVEVWRGRQIFDSAIQESIEARIDGMSNRNKTEFRRVTDSCRTGQESYIGKASGWRVPLHIQCRQHSERVTADHPATANTIQERDCNQKFDQHCESRLRQIDRSIRSYSICACARSPFKWSAQDIGDCRRCCGGKYQSS